MLSCVALGAVRSRLAMSSPSSAISQINHFCTSSRTKLQHYLVKLTLGLTIISVMLTIADATPAVPMVASIADSNTLQFHPGRRAYRFGSDSTEMECVYRPSSTTPSPPPQDALLRLRNVHVKGWLAEIAIDPIMGASLRFQVKSITSSSKFACSVYSPSKPASSEEKQAQVYVLVDGTATCQTDKQCWGYGRNVVCDRYASQRCMCAIKAARTSQDSPICTEVVTTDQCTRLVCNEGEDDCMCTRDPAIVLHPATYKDKNLSDPHIDHDEVAILNGTVVTGLRYLSRKNEECIHCYRTSSGLQSLQIGLFLVGAVLAFTAVTLMAVVIRKMWMYYRIPPDLLEASRDLERETIEREAEQMAQRDKPPSYLEVMEGDLRISGYPPPDYEELASAVRNHSDAERRRSQRRRRGCDIRELRLHSDHLGRRHNSVPNPAPSGRRLLFTPWYRAFQLSTSTASASHDPAASASSSAGTRPRSSLPTVSSISGPSASCSHLEPPSYEESAQQLRY